MIRFLMIPPTIFMLLLINACPQSSIRLSANEKTDNGKMAAYIASYFLNYGYLNRVELIETDDPIKALEEGRIDLVLDAPKDLTVPNTVALGELYPQSDSHKLISAKLYQENPKAVSLIEKLQLVPRPLARSIKWMKSNNYTVRHAAIHYLNGNQSHWKNYWGLEEGHVDNIKRAISKDLEEMNGEKIKF